MSDLVTLRIISDLETRFSSLNTCVRVSVFFGRKTIWIFWEEKSTSSGEDQSKVLEEVQELTIDTSRGNLAEEY